VSINSFNLISFLSLFLALPVSEQLTAQQLIGTGGSTHITNGGSVSATVGLVGYTTHSSNGGSIAAGIQHPYEIFSVGIDTELSSFSLGYLIYPNPTRECLTLRRELPVPGKIRCRITDKHGRLIRDFIIRSDETMISLGREPSGLYILYLLRGNELVQTFKIIKN
jgi:hypothetical protein